ncbi:MAG: LacI family DNA-binding transcriptional regulator [Acidobacteria bacterium]|nr:LacI family DNA-binding transcriptional regulator [Acidobacteriota bacterium]
MREGRLRSIADIARLAGVSKSTVSRALNDSSLIGQETKKRIAAIAKKHDFSPSTAARSLSTRSSKTVAFVNHAYSNECCVSDPFSLEIMGGVAVGLHELGYDMLVVQVQPDDTGWAGQYLESGRVDGFILMTSEKKRAHIDHLLAIGAPFIAWGMGSGAYCSVCGNNRLGGSLATQRLISIGRSRIGFLGGPRDDLEVQERYRGYTDALAAAGRGPEPSLAAFGEYAERSGERSVKELLDREPRLDALFAVSDLLAIAAIRVLHARGLRVPEDVAVVGYDDLHIASYVTPALTTVRQNIPLAGKLLARDLIAYMQKGIVTCSTVPVELVIRASA